MRQKNIVKLAKLVLPVIGIVALPIVSYAKPTTFLVDDSMGRDTVNFTSDAPIELIAGRTNKVAGKIVIDDSLDVSITPFQADFQIDLDSIDTGIEMRNQHMRDNFLETEKFPKATFKVTKVAGNLAVLKDGTTTKVNAIGEFTVHGKTVQRSIPVTVTYYAPCDESRQKSQACDAIVIKATFPVKLAEHNIQRPEMLFQKLADTVYLTVSATARRKGD